MTSKEMLIRLTDINAVKSISAEASKQPFDIELISKNYKVNCKSIMGILSLNLLKPVICRIYYPEDNQDILAKVYSFTEYAKRFA